MGSKKKHMAKCDMEEKNEEKGEKKKKPLPPWLKDKKGKK